MRISLITVCYNSVSTILDTLKSALSQKGVELEYIVVDGASKDGTVDVIKGFDADLKTMDLVLNFSFKWISEPDRGLYDAINKGIGLATGDIVGILNADDVFESQEVLSHVARAFDENLADDGARPDAIYGDIRFVNELGGRTVRYCRGKWFKPWMFRFAVMIPHPSFYCRRELFDKFGAYSLDYRICADFELVMRYMWTHQIRTKYLNECMVIMRTGGASTAGIRSSILINKEDLKALKRNGYWSSLWLVYLKYIFKIWGFLIRF